MNRHNIVKVFLAVIFALLLTVAVWGQTSLTDSEPSFSEWLASTPLMAVDKNMPFYEKFGLFIRELPDYLNSIQSDQQASEADHNAIDAQHNADIVAPESSIESVATAYQTTPWFDHFIAILEDMQLKIAESIDTNNALRIFPDTPESHEILIE